MADQNNDYLNAVARSLGAIGAASNGVIRNHKLTPERITALIAEYRSDKSCESDTWPRLLVRAVEREVLAFLAAAPAVPAVDALTGYEPHREHGGSMDEVAGGDYVLRADVQALLATAPADPEQAKLDSLAQAGLAAALENRASRPAAATLDRMMAECMDMVRQELVDAGVIDKSVPPMMVADAVRAHVSKLAAAPVARQPQAAPILGYITDDAMAMLKCGRSITVSVGAGKMRDFETPIYGQAAPEATSEQMGGAQVASAEFNAENMGHLINRLSVANRRDGWKGAAPEYSNADRERAAQAVEIAERNLFDYVKSLATHPVERAAPGEATERKPLTDLSKQDVAFLAWVKGHRKGWIRQWLQHFPEHLSSLKGEQHHGIIGGGK